MCTRVTCPRCKKPSFVGCGRHVEQVLGDVPREQRCRCAEQPAVTGTAEQRSFFERIFGR
jgi:hypothetical protein